MKPEIVFIDNKFLPLDKAMVSVLDRGFTLGDGLFETLRAYGGNIFLLKEHLNRLFDSAQQIFIEIPYSKKHFQEILEESLRINQLSEAYIRITVTRGKGSHGLALKKKSKPTVVIYATDFISLPKEYYQQGAKIVTFKNTATQTATLNPQIKSCNYLSQVIVKEFAKRKGAFEGINLLNDKIITEGTISNLFIVKNGKLKTPALSPYILPGITRKFVLVKAKELEIPCEETSIIVGDVYKASEVFIVNTAIEILPVSHVDDKKIGSGKPGRITKILRKVFFKSIEELKKR